MIKSGSLLFKRECRINDDITVVIPTVEDIIDNEDEYYSLISMFTSMPVDMAAQLDEIGIDFSTINEWELFLILFSSLKSRDTSLITGNLNLGNFEMAIDVNTNEAFLVDKVTNIKIDRVVHSELSDVLRSINHLSKNMKKPANKEAKDFMISRAKKKMRSQMRKKKNSKYASELESLIVAMVNTEQYHYDFEGTRKLTIYQFNECVKQIIKKIDYDNKMHGIYSGTVSAKDLSQDDLNWLTHK